MGFLYRGTVPTLGKGTVRVTSCSAEGSVVDVRIALDSWAGSVAPVDGVGDAADEAVRVRCNASCRCVHHPGFLIVVVRELLCPRVESGIGAVASSSQCKSTEFVGISKSIVGSTFPAASRTLTSWRYASLHFRRWSLPDVVLGIVRALSSTTENGRTPSAFLMALVNSRTTASRSSSPNGASGRNSASNMSTSPSSCCGCTENAAQQPGRKCEEPRSACASMS
eukprot:scaffold21797_cov112-Isochrysis_galbana.AAC.3